MKKTACLLLAICLILPTLSACSDKSEPFVMSYGGYGITEKQYTYWLSYYKTTFYSALEDYAQTGEEYTEQFWLTETDEGVLWELTRIKAEDYMKKLVVSLYLFDHYGLDDIEGTREQIKISVDECIADDIAALGARSTLNEALSAYKMNISDLEDMYRIEIKRSMLEEYLYGSGGKTPLTDEDKEAYYNETYARVKHILINTVDKYVLDDDGQRIIDTSTGYYKTEKLTDAEKEEKKALASTVLQKAENGEDFEELIEQYNEDEGMTYYTDGYFLTENSAYEKAFLNAAIELQTGQIKSVESAYGIHIIKKYALEKGAYLKDINKNFFSELEDDALTDKKEKMFSEYSVEIHRALDQETFSQCPLMDRSLI